MSTTPTTPERRSLEYRVVGGPRGRQASAAQPVSVLLLDRGNRLYRAELLHELDRLGFDSILAVESGGEPLELESLSARHPGLRFLVPAPASGSTAAEAGGGEAPPPSPGELINIGMRESAAPFVFVLMSDMGISTAALSGRFFERLTEQERLCLSPSLLTKGGEPLPSAATPVMEGQKLRVLLLPPASDGARSLFPFDFTGIYSREKFLQAGGFDPAIGNPYWQALDFGFRAWLWGEEIRLSASLRVAYQDEAPVLDTSPGPAARRFWLRNLAPEYRDDSVLLPGRRFWSYARSGRDLFSAVAEFRAGRDWVARNRFRFRMDATSLVDLWEDEAP